MKWQSMAATLLLWVIGYRHGKCIFNFSLFSYSCAFSPLSIISFNVHRSKKNQAKVGYTDVLKIIENKEKQRKIKKNKKQKQTKKTKKIKKN